MIDLASDQILTLQQAARRLPRRRRGRPVHPATIYRWAHVGLRGVRLEVIRMGGVTCTSTEALQRFFDQLTASTARASSTTPTPTSATVNDDLAADGW